MIQSELISLKNENFELEILNLGATMRKFNVRLSDNIWRNIILGSNQISDYLDSNLYHGMTVGRVANRLGRGEFKLDGDSYSLEINEPPNQLHGGSAGFHSKFWKIEQKSDECVELSLLSPEGDQGFPGELKVTARYELLANGAQVTYTAVTNKPTVVNITTHPYFNLLGETSGSIDEHILKINASRYTPNHPDGIPTGEIRDVADTAADFRSGKKFGIAHADCFADGINRNGGFDHNFVIDGVGFREHCQLTSPDGLTLNIQSDQPAFQLYGGNHFNGTQIGTSGLGYQQRAGLALECQGFPDAPNHENFPSIRLNPGDIYSSTTRWIISNSQLNSH